MQEEQPKDYVGVWIPAEITEREDLTPLEKWLWAEIAGYRECWASNAFLAKRMGISENWVSQRISKLEKLGLIEKVGFNGRFRIIKASLLQKSKPACYKNQSQPLTKVKPENKVENKVENKTIMPAPEKPAPARELPKEARQLAERLHKWILKNKPDRKIQNGWEERWTSDIDKMHRLDGRSWKQIMGAIDWSQRDDFWRQNVLSGANLRKHYDRIEDRARMEMEDNSNQALASQIFSQDGNQAVETARKMGLLP